MSNFQSPPVPHIIISFFLPNPFPVQEQEYYMEKGGKRRSFTIQIEESNIKLITSCIVLVTPLIGVKVFIIMYLKVIKFPIIFQPDQRTSHN
jgi:hypothetical protein